MGKGPSKLRKSKKSTGKLEALENQAAKAFKAAIKLKHEAAKLKRAADKEARKEAKKRELKQQAMKRKSDRVKTKTTLGCQDKGIGSNWDTFSAAKKAEMTADLRAAGCPGYDIDPAIDTDVDP